MDKKAHERGADKTWLKTRKYWKMVEDTVKFLEKAGWSDVHVVSIHPAGKKQRAIFKATLPVADKYGPWHLMTTSRANSIFIEPLSVQEGKSGAET